MQVSGGAIVAMPGSGWKPQDGWIQVQLSGGSIPGKEIKSIIQEGSTLVVQLKKPASDIETMDLRLTEYRVEGGDVSSIESVDIIDKASATKPNSGWTVSVKPNRARSFPTSRRASARPGKSPRR